MASATPANWLDAHALRVSQLAAPLAAALNLPQPLADRLGSAAFSHDVGKFLLPDTLLDKAGALAGDELSAMRTHPVLGADSLTRAAAMYGLDLSVEIEVALLHHERWDGRGYPNGLRGCDIPIAARAVSVIDVFDALVNERPYKAAWSPERALQYLRDGSGTQFDPQCVGAFAEVFTILGWPAASPSQSCRIVLPHLSFITSSLTP